MSTPSDRPDSEDLDDYLAECDEHLSTIRQMLLDLEAMPDKEWNAPDCLAALFRAFHTIKGLSGMVGARAVEETAHQLETYLGAVRKGNPPLTEEGLDVLLEGVRLIEEAVSAFQKGTTAPGTAPLTGRVEAMLSDRREIPVTPPSQPRKEVGGPSAGTFPPDKQARLAAALARGEQAWRVTFAPRPDLASRGVNVNTVRSRLQVVGEIVHAEPTPVPGGGIRFLFYLAAPAGVDFSSWEADGIQVEPYRPLAAEPSAASRPVAVPASAHLIRVDLGRLDELMNTVGDLVLSRARLATGLERVAGHLPPRERRELEETSHLLERQLRDLREKAMRIRMVPVRDLFARMRLVVRDLTRETGKEVDLAVAGEETEIDKFVIERMADPLLHLVRNAVSHGIEPAAERAAAGKPQKGRLALRAVTAGGTIVLEVEDDGRGVPVDEVFARARETGLVAPNAPSDPAVILDLICTPGFSTRDTADRASGRGVGMDVVRRAVEGLGGILTLDSRRGAGTRFTVRLPLTLVVADVLTVTVGGMMYAVPQTAVREVVPVAPDSTTRLENNELIRYHGGVLPLVWLGDLLRAPHPAGAFVGLVVGEGPGTVALAVDRALGLREVVVRALADPLVQVPGIGGATELGDGRPILILDPAGLARLARRRSVLPHMLPGG